MSRSLTHGYDETGATRECARFVKGEGAIAILTDFAASCHAVGGEARRCHDGPFEICSVPVFAFGGAYLDATIGEDGKVHLKIRDEDCGDRVPYPTLTYQKFAQEPPRFSANLVFDRPATPCAVPHDRDLAVELPDAIKAPAIIDFEARGGSCREVLLGVASFVAGECPAR